MSQHRYAQRRVCDVLVLGAGLAGLRAAIAAKSRRPRLKVAVLTVAASPSGSSFANLNNALGVQAPATDAEKKFFVEETLRLAPPGLADPLLAATLAKEAHARVEEMIQLGLSFRRANDVLALHPACFSPESRQALIFDSLDRAFHRFLAWAKHTGVLFWPGVRIAGLVRGDGFSVLTEDREAAVGKAVILALGGPAGLFAWSMAGKRLGGESYGLLRKAGATVANAGFLQFFWTQTRYKRFTPLGGLFRPGAAILEQDGRFFDPFADLSTAASNRLANLAVQRGSHCPAAYGLPDSVLDEILKARLDRRGLATFRTSDGRRLSIAPMAHAGNGGARIDEHGGTGVPGLFACGECATGMYGANRLGGAMVAATQVFGKRAGEAAADFASGARQPLRAGSPVEVEPAAPRRPGELGELRRRMQKSAVLGGGPGLNGLKAWLQERREHASGSWELQLLSAETIVDDLLQAWKTAGGDPLTAGAAAGKAQPD